MKRNRMHVEADILKGFFRGGFEPIREQTHPQIRLPKGVTEVLEGFPAPMEIQAGF